MKIDIMLIKSFKAAYGMYKQALEDKKRRKLKMRSLGREI